MRKLLASDFFVITVLGIGLPGTLVIVTAILLTAAIINVTVSFNDFWECIQAIAPVLITYVAAILGFAFEDHQSKVVLKKVKGSNVRTRLRIYLSLIIGGSLMSGILGLTLCFVCGIVSLDDYKVGIAVILWTLSGQVTFIVSKYFGKVWPVSAKSEGEFR